MNDLIEYLRAQIVAEQGQAWDADRVAAEHDVRKRIIAVCARWIRESRRRNPDTYVKALGIAASVILRELGGPYLLRPDHPGHRPAPILDDL
jgi:hypothetical protein